MTTLDEACKSHPNARWWIKGDGCDIISGLEESVNYEWNGDIDLGDGRLQALYQTYKDRLKRVKDLQLNIHVQNQRNLILESLACEERSLPQDITFITNGKIIIYNVMCLFIFTCSTAIGK